jgi:hypothetical protein
MPDLNIPAAPKAEAPSRRKVPRSLGTSALAGTALASASQALGAAHPDVELLRLGEEFERRRAAWFPIYLEMRKVEKLFEEELAPRGLSHKHVLLLEYQQLFESMGVEAALGAEENACSAVDEIAEKIGKIPASTFAGLAVKARALRHDCHLGDEMAMPEEDQDRPERCMNRFIAEVERLAGGGH